MATLNYCQYLYDNLEKTDTEYEADYDSLEEYREALELEMECNREQMYLQLDRE